MDKSTGIPLSKKYNFMSVRFSCKSSQRFSERSRFPTSLIWLSTSEPRSVSDRLVCSLKLLPNSQYIIHAQNNGINRSKKIVFCVAVVFIDKLHRTRQLWQVENEQYLPRDDHVTQRQREASPTYWEQRRLWTEKAGRRERRELQ